MRVPEVSWFRILGFRVRVSGFIVEGEDSRFSGDSLEGSRQLYSRLQIFAAAKLAPVRSAPKPKTQEQIIRDIQARVNARASLPAGSKKPKRVDSSQP